MVINGMIPATAVHLLQGVPLDNTYKDTLTFASKTAQYEYFYGKRKSGYSFQNLKPVRQDNVIAIDRNAYDLYDCNYVMFQNANFNDRWIYAFITDIEFINVDMCNVHFEVDVMQTWYFDYTINESFVVREHVTDDTFGKNLVPENLETGELICVDTHEYDMSNMYVCILSSQRKVNDNWVTATGTTKNGVYSGLFVTAGIPATDYSTINGILGDYITEGKEDCIVAVFQYPAVCGDGTSTQPVRILYSVDGILPTLDGYTPKNNKLFSYPYNYLTVSNNEGKVAQYQFEQFSYPTTCTFDIVGAYLTNPCMMLAPRDYRGIGTDWDSGLTLSNFPQCAWVGDAFKAWFSQNKGSLGLSAIASASTIAGGAITGNPFAVTGGVMGVAGLLGSMYDKTKAPPQVHGQTCTDTLNAGLGRIKFSFYHFSVKAQFAKIIDDFFTKFGYKVNEVKIPATNRKSFNFIQTIDANITGNIPFNDMSKIRSIYDSGVTLWHGDWIGDYSRDNGVNT